MIKINKTVIAYITLFIIFLQSLGLGLGGLFIPYFFILESLILIIVIIDKDFLIHLKNLYKKSSFRYLVWFFIWSTLTVIVSLFKHTFYLNSFLYGYIGGLGFSVVFNFIVSYYIFTRYLSIKKIIHFYIFIYFFVLVLGVADFLANQFNISFLYHFLSIFNNKRLIIHDETFEISYFNRVKSIFDEPSDFGAYICLNLPIIYSLYAGKFKTYRRDKFNKFVKIFLILLVVVNLILTKSPTSFIFFLIITFLFYLKNIIIFIKKHFLYFMLLVVSVFIFLLSYNIDVKDSYINRIFVVLTNITSFDHLIYSESSFATRIINYANTFLVFIKNWFFGIGYGNMSSYYVIQLKNSPLPLTIELTKNLAAGKSNVASAILWRILAETGLIGGILFLLFCLGLRKLACECAKRLPFSIEKSFLHGLHGSMLVLLCIYLYYGLSLHNTYLIMMFACIMAFGYFSKTNCKLHKNKMDGKTYGKN